MYIGKQPQIGNYQACDSITATATDTFNLLVGGVAVSPVSAHHCLVSLNGILQAPISSYTIVGSTIVFASALTTSDSIDFITILGSTLDTGTPSDGTVTNAKLAQDVISGETDIGAAIVDADLLLVDDGAGGTLRKTAASRIKTYVGGGITVADQWRVTANFDGSVQPITSNWEQTDGTAQGNLGSSMANSSGVWTFPSTGFYLVSFGANAEHDADLRYCYSIIDATTDNSSYTDIAYGWGHVKAVSGATYVNLYAQAIVDVTNVTNVKVRFGTNTGVSGLTWVGGSAQNNLYATFIRLGDT